MPDLKDYRLPDGSVLPHTYDGMMWRALGCQPPRPDFGGLPRWGDSNEVIPRSSWRDISFAGYRAPILNQGQHGSCVGHGAVTGFWRTWLMMGHASHDFSACWVYGLINGGRDQGAVISDALTAMQRDGVALLSEVPEGMVFKGQFPASAAATAKRFRVKAAHHCRDFDEIGSALQCGRMVVYGVYVGGSFGDLDRDGVAPAWPNRVGNHCMTGRGMKKLGDGRWVIENQNSWGESWGNGGCCYLSEEHFTGTDPDAFAIELDAPDPQESNS